MPLVAPDIKLEYGARHWPLAIAHALAKGKSFPPEATTPSLTALYRHDTTWHYVASIGAVEVGQLLIYEWLVTSPEAPARVRHRCVYELMRAGAVYAAARGKQPILVIESRGIEALAKRAGLAVRSERYRVLEGELP